MVQVFPVRKLLAKIQQLLNAMVAAKGASAKC